MVALVCPHFPGLAGTTGTPLLPRGDWVCWGLTPLLAADVTRLPGGCGCLRPGDSKAFVAFASFATSGFVRCLSVTSGGSGLTGLSGCGGRFGLLAMDDTSIVVVFFG